MKHFILTVLALFAGVLATKAQTLEYYLDDENQIVYQYHPGTGYAEVAHGGSYESDYFPQSYVHHNKLGEVLRIIEGFEVDGQWYTVQKIGGHAFFGCSHVKTIYIPETIRSIGSITFAGCTEVEDVYCYVNPRKLTWETGSYYDIYSFKKQRGTRWHVHEFYAEYYAEKFLNNNVTFVGDLVYDAEPLPQGIESVFRAYDAENGILIAGGNQNWKLSLAYNDGSTISYVGDSYWDQQALYFRLGSGTSSWKDLLLTSDYVVHGTVRKILVVGAGGIHMLRCQLPDGTWIEKEYYADGDYQEYEIVFPKPQRYDGPVEFHVYSETPFVLQSIFVVMEEENEDVVYSTFKGYDEQEVNPGVNRWGNVLTEEGNIWWINVTNSAVSITFSSVEFDGTNSTPCIVTYHQNEPYNIWFTSRFKYEGPVKKVLVHSAGNIQGMQVTIQDKKAGKSYSSSTEAHPTDYFGDYVFEFAECPEIEDGQFTVHVYGEGAIFINSITIVKREETPELPQGKCGDNLTYQLSYIPGETTLSEDMMSQIPAMKLTISGSGNMWDFDDEWSGSDNMVPWLPYRQNITVLDLPSGLKSVGNNAFSRMWNCEFPALPSGIERIGQSAFYNDYFGGDLVLPSGLLRIESNAFKAVNGATNVYIGPKVSVIQTGALNSMYFTDCYYVDKGNPTYSSEGNCVYEVATKTVIAGGKKSTIPTDAKCIGPRAFEGVHRATLDLPSTLLEIGMNAFYNCDITEIRIPDKVTSIGHSALSRCQKLLTVYVGKSMKSIGRTVFYDSSNILDISLACDPENLTWEKASSYDDESFGPNGKTTAHVRAEMLDGWVTKFAYLNLTFKGDLGDEIQPIEEEKRVDIAALKGQDLTNNTVDNVYYNLPASTGSGLINDAIVIGAVTDMSLVGSGEPGSAEVAENFKGVILKVNGKGTITIDSGAFGNRLRLAVRIGNGTPVIIRETGRQSNMISYNVQTETFVYIYAVPASASVRGWMYRAEGVDEDSVVIYGITIEPGAYDPDSINAIDNHDSPIDSATYDLNGRRIQGLPRKGIVIQNGRKVLIR